LPHLGFQFVLKAGGVFPEGEIHFFRLNTAEGYEIICKDIEGGSEIVHGVTKDGGKFCGDALAAFQCYPVLAGALVELQEHRPRIVLKVRGNSCIKFRDVSASPRNL
jgi:hypothetical protein